MLIASLPQMSKDFSLRRILDQAYYTIKKNVVKNGGSVLDVYTGAPPDVVTALVIKVELEVQRLGTGIEI